MEDNFLKIVSFGLIGKHKTRGDYRQVRFEDTQNDKIAELIIYAEIQGDLWQDILNMEKGGQLMPYKGYIGRFNNMDIVVIGDESLEDAFKREKWKYDAKGSINWEEAEKQRESSTAYATNLTQTGNLEISWTSIDKDARLIRFRSYEGNGIFSWGPWFEIDSSS